MTIKLYAHFNDYDGIEVETEREHQERIQSCFEQAMDRCNSNFSDYLNDRYTPAAVFDMSPAEKDGIGEEFKEWFFDRFDDENRWECFEKEIEI